MRKKNFISGVIRTKGTAPYLKLIVANALAHIDHVVIVDNNQEDIWRKDFQHLGKVSYKHDPREITPICTDEHKAYFDNHDHFAPLSLASFYRDAFNLAPFGFVMKLDDDDYWTEYGWKKLARWLISASPSSIVYFNGINLVDTNKLSLSTPICGGRDHFVIGPDVNYDFRNDEQWETLHFQNPPSRTLFLKLTYYHLKFYKNAPGYFKDICDSNCVFLSDKDAKNRIGGHLNELHIPAHKKIIDKIMPRLLKNTEIGCSELIKFWTHTKNDRENLAIDNNL